MKRVILCFFALALLASPLDAQQNAFVCPQNGPCEIRIVQPPQVEKMAETADMTSLRAACRVRTGGGCGSGSVVGHWNGGSLVMTNAHVAGTRVGRTVTIDAVVNGQTVTKSARVIMAAYSDRTLTDWAVLHVEGWQDIQPVKMSKDKPTGGHYTKGSPRCVWPLVATDVRTADVSDSSPLWRWRPNSIGGQSGSGVWSESDNLQYGLLTWSWGGLGAGQQTSEIYRQAKGRTVSGEPRIDGLHEVGPRATVVENGFFAETNLTDLPIWADDSTDPVDPPLPSDITARERELLDSLRARSKAVGVDYEKTLALMIGMEPTLTADGRMMAKLRQRAKERNIDFVRLIQLILELLELFR